jgi:hypothetical protein
MNPPKPPPYQPNEELLAKYPNLKEFFPFLHDLRHESPRGAVLICCSYVDDLLRDSLRSFFLDKPEA